MADYKSVIDLFRAGKLSELKAILHTYLEKEGQGTSLNNLLVSAVHDDHSDFVQFLFNEFEGNLVVNEGVSVDIRPPHPIKLKEYFYFKGKRMVSVPPLVAACTQDDVEMVRYLVSKGADLTKQAPFWGGPLHVAAQYGCISVMKYLLDSGMDINTINYRGCTPLMMMSGLSISYEKKYVAFSGRVEENPNVNDVFKFLISRQANFYVKTLEGYSVMHEAACFGRVDIVKLLLAHGISPLFSTNDSSSEGYVPCPLYLAATNGYDETVKFFCALKDCPSICKGNAYLLLASSTMDNMFRSAYEERFWEMGLTIFETSNDKPTYPLSLPEYEHSQEIKDKSELKAAWYNGDFRVIGHRYQYLLIRERCLGLHQISLVASILQSAANIRAEVETKNIDGLCQRALSVCLLNIDKCVISKDFAESLFNSILRLVSSFSRIHSECVSYVAEVGLLVYEKIGQISKMNYEVQTLVQCFEIWLNVLTKGKAFNELATLPKKFHTLGHKLVSLTLSHLTSGLTVFHFLNYRCCRDSIPQLRAYYLELLLSWGAYQVIDSPYIRKMGKRPLHCFVERKDSSVDEISLLLSHGAHVDAVDAFGKTPLDYCSSDSPVHTLLLATGPLPLSCHAARTIVSERIPYKSLNLPKHVVKLIQLHDFDMSSFEYINTIQKM